MANRSDRFSAKLPRHMKRALAMQSINMTREHYNNAKKVMISAHAAFVSFKLKRADNKDSAGE